MTTIALLAGLGLFVFAAFCGLAASRTIPYVVAHSDVYNDMVVGHWTDTEEEARQNVAYRNQRTLVSLREANNKKAWWLPVAFWAQVAAALALLIAVGNALACA